MQSGGVPFFQAASAGERLSKAPPDPCRVQDGPGIMVITFGSSIIFVMKMRNIYTDPV
jgi:hypothetical protein